MKPFARLLSAVYIGKEAARPLASEALGAVLLDAAGVTPEEIEKGRVLICVPDGVANAIDAALERIYQGRVHDLEGLKKLRSAKIPLDDRIILLDDMHAIHPDWWMSVIGEHGLGCALVVVEGGAVDPEVEAWVTRQVSVPPVDTWPVIPDALRLATGDHFVLREADFRGATVPDLRSALGLKTTASDAIKTLRNILNARRAKERRAEADAEKAEVTLFEGLVGEPVAAPVERVVKRLSEMHGFGEAGRWGLLLAEDIRDYKAGRIAWSDLDKGILLVGPPGGGKTTYARSLALECGVDLVTTSYGEWHEGGGDAVARTLKKLFDKWRGKGAEEPFVLLVDEIDSMGKRGGNGHSEAWFQTIINNWLNFLDGPTARVGVIVVATTNHVDRVDPALCRPGRLDRVVTLPYPDVKALEGIVRHHLGADADTDVPSIRAAARACRGKSPATVEQLCREARRVARRTYGRQVRAWDVVDILQAQRMEARTDGLLEDGVAVHEAGHAVVALALGLGVVHVDLDARQAGLDGNRRQHTEQDALDNMVVDLGGMAAEEIVLGIRSTGGTGDVQHATTSAIILHARAGLGAAGHVHIPDVSLDMRSPLYAAVRATTDEAWERALRLCRLHRTNIRRVADALRTERYLTGVEVQAMMRSPLRALARPAQGEADQIPCWAPSVPRVA